MAIKRRSNLFFGDEDPTNHPRNTYLWINTEENSLYFYDDEDGWTQVAIESASASSGSNGGSGSIIDNENAGGDSNESWPQFPESGYSLQSVNAITKQSDEKIIIGHQSGILRINSNGILDNSFQIPTPSSQIFAITVQPDGKILIGGTFSTVNGVTRNRIARLNSDGTLDTSFVVNLSIIDPPGFVRKILIQPDGKILIGGSFVSIDGVTRNRIARINEDGTLDSSFVSQIYYGSVFDISLDSDNKILVSGAFTHVNGVGTNSERNRIARLNSDGTLDTSFDPNANNVVTSISVQPDGKILIGGWFTTIGGTTRNRIARLNSDGTLDTSFSADVSSALNGVFVISLSLNNKIFIGGDFTVVNDIQKNGIAKLNSDGSLDTSFTSNFSLDTSSVQILSILTELDERIIVGGFFTQVDGIDRRNIVRLNSDGSLSTD